MQLTIASDVSLNEVEQQLRAFEHEYGLTTQEFCENPEHERNMSEDDALEWCFLVEQQKALQGLPSKYKQSQTRYAACGKIGNTKTKLNPANAEETQMALAA